MLTDLEVIQALLTTGRTDYFGILYDRYADKVYGKAILMVKDRDIAKDLTHDILVKSFLKINTFEGKSSFGTWLFQITYTHCIDYLRAENKIKKEEIDDKIQESKDDQIIDEEHEKEIFEIEYSRLSVLLDMLKIEEKAILLMKYQDDFSIREIADHYQISESAVKMKLKRSRDKVKELYAEQFKEELI